MLTRSLATPTPAAVDRATLVLFSVGGAIFGAPVESVERVLRGEPAPPAAGAPDWVRGSVAHAGRCVPWFDVQPRLHVPPVETVQRHAASRLLVLARGSIWCAVTVDEVQEVLTVDATLIRAVTPALRDASPVLGELLRNGMTVRVLDAARLLSPDEWRALQACQSGAQPVRTADAA